MKTSTSSNDHRYIYEIDGLRALSVILVLLFHLDIEFFRGGFIGVDIFFVISGFLITRNISNQLQAGKFTFKKFYLARVRRLFPALLGVVGITFIVGAVIMSPLALQSLAVEVLASIFSFSNIYFWMESGYFEVESATRPLLHTWSLGVEEQFYVIYPILLVFLMTRFSVSKVFALLAIILICNLILSQLVIQLDSSASFYLFIFRVFEFLIGAMIVCIKPLADKIVSPTFTLFNEFLFSLCLGVVILTSFYYDSSTSFSGFNALLPCLAAAGLLVSSNAQLSRLVLGNALATYLGRISYSVYLVHWPIIVLTKYVTQAEFTTKQQVLLFFTSLVAGSLVYSIVEKTFRYPSSENSRTSLNKRFLAGFSVTILLVSSFATYSILDDGWNWRLGSRAGESGLNIEDPRQFHTKYYGGTGCNSLGCETLQSASKKVVYVLGDSHARALFTGLQEQFPEINFKVVGPNSCAMYTEKFGYHKTKYDQYCEKAKANILAEIKAQPGPILFHSHWLARMNSAHYSKSGVNSRLFKDEMDYALFLKKSLLELFGDVGASNIIVLGGLPRYSSPLSPLDCMTRPIQSHNCTFGERTAKMVSGQDNLSSTLGEVLESDFRYINIYDHLCDKEQCRNIDDSGYPIYSDSTHLSIWGSTFLVSKLKTEILTHVESFTARR